MDLGKMELVCDPACANDAECDQDPSPVVILCAGFASTCKQPMAVTQGPSTSILRPYTGVMVTLELDATCLNNVASPTILPTMFTGDAGRISSPRLIGVGP